jgi:dynein heavy chain 1
MARAFSAELVHQRDITRQLVAAGVGAADRFEWQSQMRYYHDARADSTQALTIAMADATFSYGWEYLGVGERLVQTPLTDRLYLAMTQALRMRLGGSPFGPAGTGKTESVKALGAQLGRFVLVFNCDESFDFQAMSRILVGLCRVGAWGCFDEFNRLEERILSAVSQQIQAIQLALRASSSSSQECVYVVPVMMMVINGTQYQYQYQYPMAAVCGVRCGAGRSRRRWRGGRSRSTRTWRSL